MEELTLTSGMTWEDIDLQVHQLPDKVLKTEYRMYKRLQARSTRDDRLMMMLGNEIDRRKMSMSSIALDFQSMGEAQLLNCQELYSKLQGTTKRNDKVLELINQEVSNRQLT